MNYGTFHLGACVFAVPLTAVREVLHRPRLSPVPLAPEELAGMALFRGEVLPVFELGTALATARSRTPRARVLILQHGGVLAGVAADTAATLAASPPESPGEGLVQGQSAGCRVLGLHALFQQFETWLSAAAHGFQGVRPRAAAPIPHA